MKMNFKTSLLYLSSCHVLRNTAWRIDKSCNASLLFKHRSYFLHLTEISFRYSTDLCRSRRIAERFRSDQRRSNCHHSKSAGFKLRQSAKTAILKRIWLVENTAYVYHELENNRTQRIKADSCKEVLQNVMGFNTQETQRTSSNEIVGFYAVTYFVIYLLAWSDNLLWLEPHHHERRWYTVGLWCPRTSCSYGRVQNLRINRKLSYQSCQRRDAGVCHWSQYFKIWQPRNADTNLRMVCQIHGEIAIQNRGPLHVVPFGGQTWNMGCRSLAGNRDDRNGLAFIAG